MAEKTVDYFNPDGELIHEKGINKKKNTEFPVPEQTQDRDHHVDCPKSGAADTHNDLLQAGQHTSI
jgi:hypothetical protein